MRNVEMRVTIQLETEVTAQYILGFTLLSGPGFWIVHRRLDVDLRSSKQDISKTRIHDRLNKLSQIS